MWLYMNDQNSMHHAIEARSPFLDYRLAKYIRLPAKQKFKHGYNKYFLRKSLPAVVSDDVRYRRDKQGFRYNPSKILDNHKKEMLALVEKSDLINKYYKELLCKLDSNQELLIKLYSIACLEDVNKKRVSIASQLKVA